MINPPAAFSECGLLLLFGGAKRPLIVALTDESVVGRRRSHTLSLASFKAAPRGSHGSNSTHSAIRASTGRTCARPWWIPAQGVFLWDQVTATRYPPRTDSAQSQYHRVETPRKPAARLPRFLVRSAGFSPFGRILFKCLMNQKFRTDPTAPH